MATSDGEVGATFRWAGIVPLQDLVTKLGKEVNELDDRMATEKKKFEDRMAELSKEREAKRCQHELAGAALRRLPPARKREERELSTIAGSERQAPSHVAREEGSQREDTTLQSSHPTRKASGECVPLTFQIGLEIASAINSRCTYSGTRP
jgi:hypothetical protein